MLESEPVMVTGRLNQGRTIEEKDLIIDLMFFSEF